MSSHGKLAVRPLPHLDFICGWPGIPGSSQRSRSAAHIAGNVEVRLGGKGMKAKWLRIELRKIETVPGGENWGELIGRGPIDVWSARSGEGTGDRETDADGAHWEVLKTADFPFRINIPEALPPSAKLDKLCGIQYEVVASLCVKTKKGFMRKEDTSSVMQAVQPITLDKHELHSTWPAYNQPDTHTGERDSMRAKLRRDRYCFAPGDKVSVKVIVSSNRVEPAKLKSVAVTIKETVTFHGVKPSRKSVTSAGAQPSMQRVEVVTQKAKQIGKKLYKGDSKDYDLEFVIPKNHALMSISTGKHVEVSYTMRLYCDISKSPIIIDHIPMMMTTFTRSSSTALMKKIGFVEGLSEREMVIDDDVDDSSTVQGVSRSVRPVPSRSLSYSGSTSTGGGYDGQGALMRRDTVLTQATGGFAGRGVPGMLFSHPAYGSPAQSPGPYGAQFDGNLALPRPAFAGPIDEESRLSPMEQSALYHHSNNPTNAVAAGVNYADIASLEPTRSGFIPIRERSPNDRSSFAGFPTSGVNGPLSRPTTAQDMEEEKERLYQRARMQAERNQRRADEQRAAIAAGATIMSNGSTIQRPMSVDGASTMPASEQEKLRLWDRARREAEAYQRGFSEGASFPEEGSLNASAASSRMQTPALPRVDEAEPLQNPHGDPARRSSAMFWLDNQQEKPAASVIQTSQRSAPGPIATSYPSYQSAEEEKARLYEQAKAQTDAHTSRTSYQSSASPAALTPSTSNNSDTFAPASMSASASATSPNSNTALSEKEQMRRFYEAQNAVQTYQSRLSGAAGEGSLASPSSSAVPTSLASASQDKITSQNDSSSSATVPPSALSEKEQLARYHAAQADVQRHQAAQAASTSQPPPPPPQQQQAKAAQSAQSKLVELSEKEQLARYHAAQEQVQRFQAGQQASVPSSSSNGGAPSYHEIVRTAMISPVAAGQPSAQPQHPPALSEKEQMRKYWEARDKEAQGTTQAAAAAAAAAASASSSSTRPSGGGNGSGHPVGPAMVSPRPMYAPNFHAMPSTSATAATAEGAPPSQASSTPLPQGAFPPAYSSHAGPGQQAQQPPPVPKQRVVSYTPQTQYSAQHQHQPRQTYSPRPVQPPPPPTGQAAQSAASSTSLGIPSLQRLSLNTRGGTPSPLEGPWAPKVAAPAWADDEESGKSGPASNAAPPPLPPKTMLK